MAQNVSINGADYPAVPYLLIPITGGGGTMAAFMDTSDATAGAAQVASGYTAYANGAKLNGTGASTITGTYTSGTKNLAITTTNTTAAWFGALGMEFLREERWSAKLNQAANWPLTPTTQAQSLTWTTTYTSTAAANATYARYGKSYNGVQLDFGVYNYVFLIDAMVHMAYTAAEATLGQVHVVAQAMEAVHHWGARPRSSSGNIIYPTASTYGAYTSVASACSLTRYRNASNVQVLANNSTYGVSVAVVAPSLASTSTVKPNYFNLRIPTFGVRLNDTYMTQGGWNLVDAANTVLSCRTRVYRVPVEFGLYTNQNERLLDAMILGNTFPAEPI